MKLSLLFPLILASLLSMCISAQTVTGKLVDQTGTGLAGLQLNLYINPHVYNTTSNSNGFFTFDNVTDVSSKLPPTGYSVSENYPNPFNPRTRLLITLPVKSRVNVIVLNILGQKVLEEIDRYYSAGTSSIDLELNGLPNGIYFARVYLDNKYTVVKKLMLLYGSQHLSSSNTGLGSGSGLNKSRQYNSTLDTKIDSLVVTGSIGRKVFTNLPGLIGSSLDLGNLTIISSYIHINPDWTVANSIPYKNPHAILLGKEPFIYVCDTDNDRIVMLNTAGTVLGTLGIKKPTAISQDYRLNLIVCAEYDTVFNGTANTYSAVYKIDLVAVNHIIANAKPKLILPRTDDIINHPLCKFTAVTAFYNNSYYVARTGPNNTSISDPDNSIIPFVYVDQYHDTTLSNRVPNIDPLGSGFITANGINCMTSFNKKNLDFIATFNKGVVKETVFKAQWFHYFSSIDSVGYSSGIDQSTEAAFVRPDRFGAPTGCCVDASGNIFIADGDPGKDSVFKFSPSGDELQSFGGPTWFSKPAGVAFFDNTLYVLDSQKNMIRRFILSTDIVK
jgi:hypothetical protein